MNDQASRLRERMQARNESASRQTRVVTVTSGKGGVGKSNFTLNFALGLIELGKKVVIFDVDLGLANIDVLMGKSSKSSILDMVESRLSIWDVIEQGPNGLEYIAGGSGFNQIFQMDEQTLEYFFRQLQELQGYTDFILFDTGAGISKQSLQFVLAADDVILVTTPEPTSLTDAYAVIKVVHGQNEHVPFRLVVNRVGSYKEGKMTADKISMVAQQFLGVTINPMGFIPDDDVVMKSVKKQTPFYLSFPNSHASEGIRRMARAFTEGSHEVVMGDTGMKGFIRRIRKWI